MLRLSHLLAFFKEAVNTVVFIYESDGETLLAACNTQEYEQLENTAYLKIDAEVKNYTILDDGCIKIVLKKEDK